MRKLGCWLLAAGMLGGAAQARAEQPKLDTTADLVAYCDNEGPVGEVRDGQNFCDGFIAGTGLFYIEMLKAKQIKQIACADPIPTLSQAREALLKWADANPKHLSDAPIDGFWRAMAATYPCHK